MNVDPKFVELTADDIIRINLVNIGEGGCQHLDLGTLRLIGGVHTMLNPT